MSAHISPDLFATATERLVYRGTLDLTLALLPPLRDATEALNNPKAGAQIGLLGE